MNIKEINKDFKDEETISSNEILEEEANNNITITIDPNFVNNSHYTQSEILISNSADIYNLFKYTNTDIKKYPNIDKFCKSKLIGSKFGATNNIELTDNSIINEMKNHDDLEISTNASEPSDTDSSQLSINRKINYKKVSFDDVLNKINKHFEQDVVQRYSSAMDIVASYLKGQKIIYIEARSYNVFLLNILMFPSIIFAVFGSIGSEQLSSIIDNAATVLACSNAIIAFLLAVVNYSKLEAISEAHKISAHQYDKLQSFLEFQSGQILLFSDPILSKQNISKQLNGFKNIYNTNPEINELEFNKQIYDKNLELFERRDEEKRKLIDDLKIAIAKLEDKVSDIKNNNQFVIPRIVRNRFPIIYNTNVFSIIKKIDDFKIETINNLKHTKNEIRYINALQKKYNYNLKTKYNIKLKKLFIKKEEYINNILYLNTAYSLIDKIFLREITNAEIKKNNRIRFFINGMLIPFLPLRCNKIFLPRDFIPLTESNNELLCKIMDLQGDSQESIWDIFYMNNRYDNTKKKYSFWGNFLNFKYFYKN